MKPKYTDKIVVKPDYDTNQIIVLFLDRKENIIDSLHFPPSKAQEVAKLINKAALQLFNKINRTQNET
jgi:hypothetical protein